ncbi:hypothetical protein DFQ26_001394, partial [Actinomortierella ambigua]
MRNTGCMKLKAKEASASKSDTPAPAAVPSFSGPASNRGSFYKSKPARVNQVKRTRLIEHKAPIFSDSDWYGPDPPRVCGVSSHAGDSPAETDFAFVHVSVNGHTTSAMVDTGADITIIDLDLALQLRIPSTDVGEFLTVAIGSNRFRRQQSLSP